MKEQESEPLPDWEEWPITTRMSILATYRWWHLFDEGGHPKVVRRFKKKVEEGGKSSISARKRRASSILRTIP